jgi:hypothetical protein
MDISQTLRKDGVALTTLTLPKSVQLPLGPNVLVVSGMWGRWVRFTWVSILDPIVEEFEKVGNHKILSGSSPNCFIEAQAANRCPTEQTPTRPHGRPDSGTGGTRS